MKIRNLFKYLPTLLGIGFIVIIGLGMFISNQQEQSRLAEQERIALENRLIVQSTNLFQGLGGVPILASGGENATFTAPMGVLVGFAGIDVDTNAYNLAFLLDITGEEEVDIPMDYYVIWTIPTDAQKLSDVLAIIDQKIGTIRNNAEQLGITLNFDFNADVYIIVPEPTIVPTIISTEQP